MSASYDFTAHLVNVGQDTTTSDGGADEQIELLVATDSQLQVTGGDTLHTQVLRGIS